VRPATAAWMASGRSVTTCDLKTKPLAPASMAASIRAESSREVRNRILVGAPTFFKQRAASNPSITGIKMSSTRTSGCSRSVASMACSPFNTDPTTSNSTSRSRKTVLRICSLSSANKTRGFFNGAEFNPDWRGHAAGPARPAVFGSPLWGTTDAAIYPACSQPLAAAPKTPPSLNLLEARGLVVAPKQSAGNPAACW
jgi:hypothetical protein